jgi:protein-arginine kinase activator protein McsA
MEAVNESIEINAGGGPSSLCTNCRQNPAYLANKKVNDVAKREAWCPTCIEKRFTEARVRFKHASYHVW